MNKFTDGDKIRIVNNEELLEMENQSNKLTGCMFGIELDSIEPGMTGTVLFKGMGDQYFVNFGEDFEGISHPELGDGCVFVHEDLLELVEEETHNEVEESDDDYDLMITVKIKGNTATATLLDNGETFTATSEVDKKDILTLRAMARLTSLVMGDSND